jgi:hypothetical protein
MSPIQVRVNCRRIGILWSGAGGLGLISSQHSEDDGRVDCRPAGREGKKCIQAAKKRRGFQKGLT